MVVLDAMEKTAKVRVLQAELNDQPGVVIKLTGALADVEAAVDTARRTASEMGVAAVVGLVPGTAKAAHDAVMAVPDFNALIEQPSVQQPRPLGKSREGNMNEQANFAVGLIETQGFTAVFEAIDTAVKTANVEVLAREKLGGGYITVVIKGDVAAVRAAIEAGKARVEGLGRLIAAHVIPSPSQAVLSLLPQK